MIRADVAIVGAGIAGASAAAFLAGTRSVILLEREDAPGTHATGRSAALFSETYGNAVVRGLSVASRAFLDAPPPGFAEHPILTPRGALHVGAAGDESRLARLLAEGSALVPSVRAVSGPEARAMVPALRPEVVIGGVLEPDARDIDTHGLLQGFLRMARQAGGRVLTRAEVLRIGRDRDGWVVETAAGMVSAAVLVNAAGAWADTVATMAGVGPLGLAPKRRTAFLFEPPPELDVRGWPLVIGAGEDVYFKPDAGMLLGSPADETPSEPVDAQADELDVAIAVDRIGRWADLPVQRVPRRWAGLRTFAPDRTPVVGYDPRRDGFFWLAGQGGYGFQTAPALGRIAAALVAGEAVPADIAARGVVASDLAPERLLFEQLRHCERSEATQRPAR